MKRIYLYPILLILFLMSWSAIFMMHFTISDVINNWATSLSMLFGSLVAGSTPLGGGAVAFPVFTKLLEFEATSARFFSLAIQSIGMTFASLFFISKKVTIYWSLIIRLLPYAITGLIFGFSFEVSGNQLKVLYSFLLLSCCYLLMQSNNSMSNNWSSSNELYVVAFFGGMLSACVGAGADTLLFFFLVLRQKMNAKSLIPTSVSFMALISIFGATGLIFIGPWHANHQMFYPWFFAAPIVAIGAPLGSYLMSKINEKYILRFIYILIFIEVTSTLIILDFSVYLKILLSIFTCYITLQATKPMLFTYFSSRSQSR